MGEVNYSNRTESMMRWKTGMLSSKRLTVVQTRIASQCSGDPDSRERRRVRVGQSLPVRTAKPLE